MKPPARQRKPRPEPVTSTVVNVKWKRGEQRKLINSLKRRRRGDGGNVELDYASLRRLVFPERSTSEIQSYVESLKNKVIAHVSRTLGKKLSEDKKAAKPIEVWTQIASSIAGKNEPAIFAAFSQMLTVASTEPDTLKNCDPPQVYRPPSDQTRPIGRTVPFRPMARLPAQGKPPVTITPSSPLVVKTRVSTKGRKKALQTPTQVTSVPNGKVPSEQRPSSTAVSPPAATSNQLGTAEEATQPPASLQSVPQNAKPLTRPDTPICSCTAGGETHRKDSSTQPQPAFLCTCCTNTLTSCSPQTSPCFSSTTTTPVTSSATSTVPSSATVTPAATTATSTDASSSSATSTCSDTNPAPPPSTTLHAKNGHPSKTASKDIPRTLGLKHIVDFERIYQFLSAIHKPDMDYPLTPMECAIVLDLLMSLPEEASLLDCHRLHKHLVQVHRCLTSPANSIVSIETLKNLRDRLSGQTDAQSGTSSTRPDAQQASANGTRGGTQQPNEAEHHGASWSSNTRSQSGEADVLEPWPVLNPFLVPLKLLKRK